MDLYSARQQFTLGAYKTLAELALPKPAPTEYAPLHLYKARSLIALGRASEVSSLVPADTESLSLKAVKALARYVVASTPGAEEEEEDADATLEELRDLCVEIEGDEGEVRSEEKWQVRVIAGTAFARAGEVEEALETLAVRANRESLEAVHLTAQLYLSIARADLARQVVQRAASWCEDDAHLQAIEATLSLATGSDGYADAVGFYTEQLGNPAVASAHLLVARGVARLMRGEVVEARSDLEEVVKGSGGVGAGAEEEALSASVVAAGLPGAAKREEAEELFSQLSSKYPANPLVKDLEEKSALFDSCAAIFTVPTVAARA